MSYIERLSISGIRSYDSDKMELITFARPVTLFVGRNGSGKTVIQFNEKEDKLLFIFFYSY